MYANIIYGEHIFYFRHYCLVLVDTSFHKVDRSVAVLADAIILGANCVGIPVV